MGSIPRRVKILLAGILPLLGLVILTIFGFQFGFGKIAEVRAKVSQARSDVNTLQSKLNLLRAAQATIATSSNQAALALPSENPVLTLLVQLKTLASLNAVTMENVKAGGESKDTSGLGRADVSFDIVGPRTQIFQFLSQIPKIAPISAVDKVKLTEIAGSARATVTVKTFWAELPTKLPAVDQEIKDLTPDELKVINEISNLILPSTTQITPSEGGGKSDPFNF